MTTTETASSRFREIETWDSAEMMDAMIEGQLAAIAAVRSQAAIMAQAVDAAAARLEQGGRLIYLGAGTSGRIATLDAAELLPTFAWPPERAVSLMAGGSAAYTQSIEGAEDDTEAPVERLAALGLTGDDVVIGVAASGRTPFVRAGLAHARAQGALTVAVVNNAGTAVAGAAEIAIVPETGPEVLAGSTRMKAGTAQKAVLTCLSTGIFLKMGYVYRGRMVEMAPSNAKLRERAVEMIADLADVAPDIAEAALRDGGDSIKRAVVMLKRGVTPDEADALLVDAGGRLHRAIAPGFQAQSASDA
ncbi:N-acetylmuramic acid 6-phosphate etherase [Oceaniovalibus guishaninsula JLT2003]|uniref:N-acetylmuramic acid 6-phosphate etherase n=1 Tax=Oceaniovalibus guishaninsula JLT2003 TaxID=1231392 RepID=K2H981_9RHOB|nr:N-acetylmuramic acid 6-phosphate etherase [Oceaniovalibus guishaninsula]EKE43132.1 N-acetylmuramic acid 6-phosphate etherase [Oceaniovalibus guishaninsula JLT2003]